MSQVNVAKAERDLLSKKFPLSVRNILIALDNYGWLREEKEDKEIIDLKLEGDMYVIQESR